MNPKWKKIILIIAANMLLLEVMSLAGIYILFDANYSNMQIKKQELVSSLPQSKTKKTGLTNNGPRALHPYYGFTYKPGEPEINTKGFNDAAEFPPKRKHNHLMIGIFGGSVARDFAKSTKAHEVLEKKLLPAVHAAGYDYFSIYNFAVAGWRYPQQYLALKQYYRHLDLTITLDGFNEIANMEWMVNDGVPADFPVPQVWSALSSSLERSNLIVLAKLIESAEQLRSLTSFFSLPLIRQSAASHLLWQASSYFWQQDIAKLKKKMGSMKKTDPFIAKETADKYTPKVGDQYLADYKAAISDADQLARLRGKQAFFFLQPNQYIPKSKPFTKTERKIALSNKAYKQIIPAGYKLLDKIFKDVKEQEVMAHSLVDTFYKSSAEIYRDDCCHVTEEGNGLMAAQIATIITNAGILQMVPQKNETASVDD